jgi:hypothetical protein
MAWLKPCPPLRADPLRVDPRLTGSPSSQFFRGLGLSISWAVTQFCGRESGCHRPIDFCAHAGNFPEGYRVCVKTRFGRGQRLKPHLFYIRYSTAEAVPYKDSVVATQALQPVGVRPCKDQNPEGE